MVILITGASHTGKTLLAQQMLEKYHYPYFSVDHLKMGLIRSGNTALTPEGDDALTDYLWPIVREMIRTAIENHQNLIVEGCYVPADWQKDFDDEYRSQIRFICLAFSDAYIDACFSEIRAHEAEIESRPEDPEFTAAWLKAENRKFMERFQHTDGFVLIDADYESRMDALLR